MTTNTMPPHDGDRLCRLLEWDSSFFGCRVATVEPTTLDDAGVRAALDWAATHDIDCLTFRSELEAQSVAAATAHAFRLVDLRMTFELQHLDAAPAVEPAIRVAQPGDVAALRAIARVSHRDTRFYNDPHFSRSRCDLLYETWIERSCQGYADVVLVADVAGRPVGYVSCHATASGTGQIGLLAVDAAARGQGIGRALLDAALSWFSRRAIAQVSVVTQGRNLAAQRLYQRSGFVAGALQLWYHRWFGSMGELPDERV